MEEVIYRQPEKRSWEEEGRDESTGKVGVRSKAKTDLMTGYKVTNGGKIQWE